MVRAILMWFVILGCAFCILNPLFSSFHMTNACSSMHHILALCQISGNACISKKLIVPKALTRCTTHNATCETLFSSPSRSVHLFLHLIPMSLFPFQPDILLSRLELFGIKARVIWHQITNPQNKCAHSIQADKILTDKIVCLEHWISCLRANLPGEQDIIHCTISHPRTRFSSRCSDQFAALAVQETEQKIAHI